MSLFRTAEEHAANPPASWRVVKACDRVWHLVDTRGDVLQSCKTRREAEELRETGFYVNLYRREAAEFAEAAEGYRYDENGRPVSGPVWGGGGRLYGRGGCDSADCCGCGQRTRNLFSVWNFEGSGLWAAACRDEAACHARQVAWRAGR